MSNDIALQFRRAIEERDLDAMLACLAEDAVLHSPAAAGLTFEGHEQLAELFSQTLSLYEDQRLTGPLSVDATRILTIDARVGAQPFREMLVMELGGDGLIREMRPYIRPLAGLVAVAAAVGDGLAARRGFVRQLAFKGLMGPLVPMTRWGERFAVRLLSVATAEATPGTEVERGVAR